MGNSCKWIYLNDMKRDRYFNLKDQILIPRKMISDSDWLKIFNISLINMVNYEVNTFQRW